MDTLAMDEQLLGAMVSPVFTFESLAKWHNITAEELQEKVVIFEILELTTSDGGKVFPAWQFNPDGSVNENILKIVRILSVSADPWTVALWLCVSQDENDTNNSRPTYLDLLAGENVDDIVLSAQLDASGWRN